jgi:transcriptional regulator with XRE-family HTH domain
MIKLRNIRTSKNLTTSELASRVGISQSYYSHIENGRRPLKKSLAEKLAKVLGVETSFVMETARLSEENSDRLNSWIGYLRINGTPFVRAFGYYLKDEMVPLKNENDLKRLMVEFISKNISASVRVELEENQKLMERLVPKLNAIVGKDIF